MIFLFAYLSYGLAEFFELSGTLTLLFCSLTISHYGYRNLSKEAKTSTRVAFEMIGEGLVTSRRMPGVGSKRSSHPCLLAASVAEAFSFVYIGLSLSGYVLDGTKAEIT
jgi:hypothetical protein